MHAFIDSSTSWDALAQIPSDVKDELEFWRSNTNHLNGYKIKQTHAISKVVYTDANEMGYGGYILQKLGNVIAHGKFTEAD